MKIYIFLIWNCLWNMQRKVLFWFWFWITHLLFIVSFQGEPGVRGPPGPSGPRGIGTQGPKVRAQVCSVWRSGTISDNTETMNFMVFTLVLPYLVLITAEKPAFLTSYERWVNRMFTFIKPFSSSEEIRKLVSPKEVVAQCSKYF